MGNKHFIILHVKYVKQLSVNNIIKYKHSPHLKQINEFQFQYNLVLQDDIIKMYENYHPLKSNTEKV